MPLLCRSALRYAVDAMSFFGVLIAVVAVGSIACLLAVTNQASHANSSLSQEFSEYSAVAEMETFYNVVVNTEQNQTPQTYGSWIAALSSSAKTIGVGFSINNRTMIIRPVGSDIYAVLRLS